MDHQLLSIVIVIIFSEIISTVFIIFYLGRISLLHSFQDLKLPSQLCQKVFHLMLDDDSVGADLVPIDGIRKLSWFFLLEPIVRL